MVDEMLLRDPNAKKPEDWKPKTIEAVNPTVWRAMKFLANHYNVRRWQIINEALYYFICMEEQGKWDPATGAYLRNMFGKRPAYVRMSGATPVLDTDFPGGKFPKELEDDRDHASEDFQRDAEYDAEERRQHELEADDLDGILKEGEDK